ncbi:helix-turn-helix transcriptional regulator [Aestuariimicrobium kwangyangense]|uniref:helix-turn-helix transcriptional regulator n=1 Tax=Aestuariimicrobium kwangyangense TaxID=396389 RepID=UPI0003B7A606|nr:helix-turn-helix transcriptional regulator [Aestuariimicrobium kwangyangense]
MPEQPSHASEPRGTGERPTLDQRAEVREFLTTRRAKVSPAEAGLPSGGDRRVPGLRRSEVAQLAGVSIEYYTKLERGSLGGASASVLSAIARALRLDDAERAHLFNLAHAADGTAAGMRAQRRSPSIWTPPPALGWALDNYVGPALVRNGRMDLLATNQLGHAMHQAMYDVTPTGQVPNFVRFTFLHPTGAHEFYPDWLTAAEIAVAILHTEAGRDAHDKQLQRLVGEVATRSEEFRTLWGRHDVRTHGAGTKRFHHRVVGDLELAYESLELASEPGLSLTLYAAEPGSPTAHALDLLGSWTAAPAARTGTPAGS